MPELKIQNGVPKMATKYGEKFNIDSIRSEILTLGFLWSLNSNLILDFKHTDNILNLIITLYYFKIRINWEPIR